jgi:hypothetical protein
MFQRWKKNKVIFKKSLYYTGCGRNNSHISKEDYKQMVRGITKNFLFPKCRYQKFFFVLGFKNYIVQMVAVTADKHVEPFFFNGLL